VCKLNHYDKYYINMQVLHLSQNYSEYWKQTLPVYTDGVRYE